jgi:hypothetical protein
MPRAQILPGESRRGPIRRKTLESEEAIMTTNQSQALWELCRQGLPLEADEAAEHWDKGQPFVLENGVHLARYVEALLRQCNWEVERSARAA